ncbi:hypothetical protein EDEG_00612 [Edhazardia aedis USNM 41457]|uniref:Transcription initiation factor IIA subunit 2 n=1 Tax=Edhazardia aedis (strain USNM 41457) TaxID=1003232 RepID=J9DVM8_EDHAE|nr:hypothetical protein EDEG_00612 [Edhazardia aedis USNM 41457]|eukprot:EJW05342.1 hypothetical protein EDEG_00612 [Edhazardia aedis USNM 41457]
MYTFYRKSLVGKALAEALEQKINDNEITAQQARAIMEKFDSVIPNVFQRTVQTNINFKGTVHSYNHVDGVWKFSTTNFVMTVNNELIRSEFVKIVACDADSNIDSGRKRRGRRGAGQ